MLPYIESAHSHSLLLIYSSMVTVLTAQETKYNTFSVRKSKADKISLKVAGLWAEHCRQIYIHRRTQLTISMCNQDKSCSSTNSYDLQIFQTGCMLTFRVLQYLYIMLRVKSKQQLKYVHIFITVDNSSQQYTQKHKCVVEFRS